MAPSPIVATTLQAAILSATSNILAQAITARQNDEAFSIDWIPVLQFLVFTIVATPPNFLWQEFLESSFPAHPQPKTHPKKSADEKAPPQEKHPPLSIPNTITKLVLDQTLSASVNTLLFSTFTRALRFAMHPAPRITSLLDAAKYWASPGAIDFARVDFQTVWDESLDEFWPLITAGLKLWPAVALVNFTLIKSVQGRNLVGALAGIAWGVYICIKTGN